MRTTQALITVGGGGSRLKRAGINVPLSKSFIIINRRPIFYWCLSALWKAGIKKLVIIAEDKQKIRKAQEVLASFPHKFLEIKFFKDRGLGFSGLPYQARKLLDKTFFFDCGHSISEPAHYKKIDKIKGRTNIVFSAFSATGYAPRTIIKMISGKVCITEKFSVGKRLFEVCTPALLDGEYVKLLPRFKFSLLEILKFYANNNKLKLVQSRLPIEMDVRKEYKRTIPIYKRIT